MTKKATKKAAKKDEVALNPEQPFQHPGTVDDMNLLANRIYEGQSIDLGLGDRISRIRAALKDKGYSTSDIENVELPEHNSGEDYKKYL